MYFLSFHFCELKVIQHSLSSTGTIQEQSRTKGGLQIGKDTAKLFSSPRLVSIEEVKCTDGE